MKGTGTWDWGLDLKRNPCLPERERLLPSRIECGVRGAVCGVFEGAKLLSSQIVSKSKGSARLLPSQVVSERDGSGFGFKVEGDLGLQAKANVTTDKGGSVRVDSNEGTFTPIEDAKDVNARNRALSSIISDERNYHRLRAVEKRLSQMLAQLPLISGCKLHQ
ncbi:MAG: hypothetical protein RMK89_05575, partial [Armatimonadota bacterium]|nr:hypothetical protein [Armatimonadota bacterium]MDW8142917.1 hypothetical protein [Armatimonadota bacterium]